MAATLKDFLQEDSNRRELLLLRGLVWIHWLLKHLKLSPHEFARKYLNSNDSPTQRHIRWLAGTQVINPKSVARICEQIESDGNVRELYDLPLWDLLTNKRFTKKDLRKL